MKGKALIFCAPSGSGKSTIVRHLLASRPDLQFSISATTRAPRAGEKHGKDYYFLSKDEFEKKLAEEKLLEWEEVYPGIYYGTLLSEIDRIWKSGAHVVFDVDVVGGVNLKQKLGERALAVFVKVAHIAQLEARLRSRGTESEESLAQRLGKAGEEMKYESSFDVTLVNDALEQTLKEAEQLVTDFLTR
ncbi:MAG: guanylate kinase [Cyclobacteriaceae bacterium]|nr:guanylate kinase [Cyclobacteriaceae bacterium]